MLGRINKYPIQLSDGNRPARQIGRAHILLKTAEGLTAEAISAALGVSQQIVFTVRRQAATEGIDKTLCRTGGARPAR